MQTNDTFYYLVISADSSAIVYKDEAGVARHFSIDKSSYYKNYVCFVIDQKHEFLLKMFNYFLSGQSPEKEMEKYYNYAHSNNYQLSKANSIIQNIISILKNLHPYFTFEDDLATIIKYIEEPIYDRYVRDLVTNFQKEYDTLNITGQIDSDKTCLHFDKETYKNIKTFKERNIEDYNKQYKTAYSYTKEKIKQIFEKENKIFNNLFLPIYDIEKQLLEKIVRISGNFSPDYYLNTPNEIFDKWFSKHFEHPDKDTSIPNTSSKGIQDIHMLKKYLEDYMNFVSNPSNPRYEKLDFSLRFNYFCLLNTTYLTSQMENFRQIPDIFLKFQIVEEHYFSLNGEPTMIVAPAEILMQRERNIYNEDLNPNNQDELSRLRQILTIEKPFSDTTVIQFDSVIQLIIWELSIMAKENIILRCCRSCNTAFITKKNNQIYCEKCQKNKFVSQIEYQKKIESDDGNREYRKIKNRIQTRISRANKKGDTTKAAELKKQLKEWNNETNPYKEQYKQKKLLTDEYKKLLNASYEKIFLSSSTNRNSS